MDGECDCCGFSETDMNRWKFRAEDMRDKANALEERIAELEATINCADELLEMGMRELAQDELRKALEPGE